VADVIFFGAHVRWSDLLGTLLIVGFTLVNIFYKQ